MQQIVYLLVIAALGYWLYRFYKRRRAAHRARRIDAFVFPGSIRQKLIDTYPHLTEQDTALVMSGLREYFHLCNSAPNRMVSMPSQVVDVAWHAFILFTRQYQIFCRQALGRFLHHTPAEAMSMPTAAQRGIKTAWRIACARERIDPRHPDRLPLLFALDEQLNIPDGFKYALDCRSSGSGAYCASHIGCGSGCASGCAGGASCGSSCGSSGCGGGD